MIATKRSDLNFDKAGCLPRQVGNRSAYVRRMQREVFDSDSPEIVAQHLRSTSEFMPINMKSVAPRLAQRLFERQTRSAPQISVFGDWSQPHRRKTPAKLPLYSKLTYIQIHMERPQTFLTDVNAEIDNNRLESIIRLVTRNRTNSFLASHDNRVIDGDLRDR